jgi:hypothetical protein
MANRAIIHFYSLRSVLIDATRSDGQQQNASIKCGQREYKTIGPNIISRTDKIGYQINISGKIQDILAQISAITFGILA